MWDDLWVAMALMLVLEGIVPFLTPRGFKRMLESVQQVDDRHLRIGGLVSMVAGVVFLYVIH